MLEKFETGGRRPGIEHLLDAIRSEAILVGADVRVRKREMFSGKREVHIHVDHLRNLRRGTRLEQVFHTGEFVEFLPPYFRRPVAVEIALDPQIHQGETAQAEIEDTHARGDKIGLFDFCRKQSNIIGFAGE